jgi:CelD/BcsL family acetyltransferase involved in cellulose biosynthesis
LRLATSNTHRSAGSGYDAQVRTELYGGPPEELATEWGELYRFDPSATPFVSPGWGLAWMRHLGRGAHPWLITVRADGELVGLAPLALERRRGMRVVRLLGKEPGDYWDVLSVPEHRDAVARAVASELSRLDDRWDVFFLNGQPGDSATGAVAARRSLRVRPRGATPCPLIALPDDFDQYLRLLPSSHRGNIRKHLRRLDRGDVVLREVTDVRELDRAIVRWHELHLKRWETLSEPIDPTHLTGRFREFVLDAMRALVPQDLATVWEFSVDGEVVGVYVNLIDENAFYWYLGGFEPSYARLGIGKMSIGHGIRWSIETGRRYFDLTRGGEGFKYYFGASDRHCPSVVVGNERLRSRAAFAASDLRDRLGRTVRRARLRLREDGSAPPNLAVLAGEREDAQSADYRERVSIGPR